MSQKPTATPQALAGSLLANRGLLLELVRRDFIGRYRGSAIGLGWSLVNPLLLLGLYTFVFSVAFKARWGSGDESRTSFAVVLFAGMIVHAFFAECINRAPSLIVGNPNYVKKVVFPLELLPCVTLLSALIHLGIGFFTLLAFCWLAGTPVQASAVLAPVTLVPLALTTLGVSWLLASLGVYLRDLGQMIGLISTITLFLAPVFYPIEALPESYRGLIGLNPITLPVTQFREAVLWGTAIDWSAWTVSLCIGIALCLGGFWWFQRTRSGFADVV